MSDRRTAAMQTPRSSRYTESMPSQASQLPQKSRAQESDGRTRSNCGSGLAREGGGSASSSVTDTPHSRASPLPHLDLSTSGRCAFALLLPCFCFNHSGRLLGRRALAFDLAFDLDLRRPVKPRWPNAGFGAGVNRQDAGLAALGQGWPIAAAPAHPSTMCPVHTRCSKVSRRKGGTHSSPDPNNGYVPSSPAKHQSTIC